MLVVASDMFANRASFQSREREREREREEEKERMAILKILRSFVNGTKLSLRESFRESREDCPSR